MDRQFPFQEITKPEITKNFYILIALAFVKNQIFQRRLSKQTLVIHRSYAEGAK